MKNNICIENRKVRHNYFVEDTIECGIVLRGNEVKSVREGKVSLVDSYIECKDRELILLNSYIAQWSTANSFDVEERRPRKLLAHKQEIQKWYDKVKIQGYTIMPLKMYFAENGKCKLLIGLCKGKHLYDKRESDKEKQIKRDIARATFD